MTIILVTFSVLFIFDVTSYSVDKKAGFKPGKQYISKINNKGGWSFYRQRHKFCQVRF